MLTYGDRQNYQNAVCYGAIICGRASLVLDVSSVNLICV
jgi:hypothetical protein